MLCRAKNTPTRSFVSNLYISQHSLPENGSQTNLSNIKSFLPVEAEISVTKVFITANMKNSKSRGKQEVDVR